MIGGKREGAGRPAPLGRKNTCTVRLDPQVEAFCRANGGLAMLNEMCRKSKEFRAWVRKEAPTSRDKPQSPGKPQRRES